MIFHPLIPTWSGKATDAPCFTSTLAAASLIFGVNRSTEGGEAWVLATHFLFPVAPDSKANILAPILFNFAAIVAIYLGIRERYANGEFSFKQGIKTGVAISLVYGISSCLFFLIVFLLVGPRLLASEPMAQDYPMWQAALGAFAGMFFGALVLGLVYSTVISFMLVKASKT